MRTVAWGALRSSSVAFRNSSRALAISVVAVAVSTPSMADRQNLAMRWLSMRWRPATFTRWPTGLPSAASYCDVPWWARASTLASACSSAATPSREGVVPISVALWSAQAPSSFT